MIPRFDQNHVQGWFFGKLPLFALDIENDHISANIQYFEKKLDFPESCDHYLINFAIGFSHRAIGANLIFGCKSLQNYNYKYDLRRGWANDAASIAVICGCGRHRISPEYSKNIIQCGNKIDNGCCSNPATIPKARRKSIQLLGQSFAVDRLIETGKGRGLNEYYNTPEYRSIFLADTFTTVARAEQLVSPRLPDLLGHNPSASLPIHSRQEG